MKLLLNGGGSTKQLKLTMSKLNQIMDHSKPILYVPLTMDETKHPYDSCYDWFQKQIENVDVPNVDMPKTFEEFASKRFDINNIHSVRLNLLDGQVDIILRALELYGYNLDYMLNSTDASDDMRQENLALLKYTYEQVLATQAEQVDSKSDNIDNLPNLGKMLIS